MPRPRQTTKPVDQAVAAELRKLGATDSVEASVAMALAKRLVAAEARSAAALARALQEVMHSIRTARPIAEDPLAEFEKQDELKARRDARAG